MELKPHQLKVVKEAANKWGLWFRMRVGKTPTSIRLATSRVESALVVCPKSLTEQWKREIELWRDDSPCHFEVISRETFRRDWNKLPKRQAIIFDEVHRAFGNYKTQAFKAADAYIKAHNIEYVWLLTGTPFTASSWSVYSYGKLLCKKWDWYKWSQTFFYTVKMGNRRIPMPKKGMDGKLQETLRSIGTVIDLKDVAEVADDEDIFEYFDLNKTQKDTINNLNDVVPISRYIHEHEIESGVLKGDDYTEGLFFECDKDKRLIEIIEENKKIIIVAKYLQQIEKYEQLAQKANRRFYTIRGGQKRTASEIADSADDDENCIVFIQGDTCDGYDLKSFDIMVFTSMSYSFVNYDQIKSRMKSMEKKTPNTYIHFITRGDSMDKAVLDSVSHKQTFSFELYAKQRE